jgi:protein-S-isoprenylcysteine O-methyltransferase Ste14
MPKFIIMFSITLASCLAGYLMFVNINEMISWLQPYKADGNFIRQVILLTCILFYILRLFITTFVFLKRKLVLMEAIIVAVLMSFAIFSFAHIGGSSPVEINALDYSGIILFLIGSWINTQSEYTRHIWKKSYDHQGELYTDGLFKYSMHINYFGDILLFTGLALITQNISLLIIPLFMALNFIFFIIPRLDKYLANKYGDEFIQYASRTKKLIPGIY